MVVAPFLPATGSKNFRDQTIAALVQQGHQVLPDKSVATAVERLGLRQLSDNYVMMARELNATRFVEGAITSKKGGLTATVTAKNSRGVQVGRAIWSGSSPGTLQSKIQSGLSSRLQAVLSGAPPARTAQSRSSQGRRSLAAKPNSAAAISVQESIEEEESPSRSNTIDMSIGTQFYTRRFAYNQNVVGVQQGHRSAGVPAPNMAVDFFFMRGLGITLGAEYSLAQVSQDRDNNRHRTSSFGYWAGAKARFDVGGDLMVGAAYGENRFRVSKDDRSVTPPQIANLSYRQLILGASTRVDLGRRVALVGGGNYLHLLGFGQLQSADYFPRITGRGGEGYAGVAIPVSSGFEARVMANLRRYVFAMNTGQADPRVAGGAVDQYMGVNLAVAYRD